MEKQGKIAVLGDKDSVELFLASGADVYPVRTEFEATDALKELTADGYAVIFITENIASLIPSRIEALRSEPFPVVIPIPSAQGSSGFAMENILRNVERAVGVRDIL